MFNNKKGQLTLFIVIAVVVIILIFLYFYFQGFSGQNQYDEKVAVLRDDVLDCFESNYETSLNFIGVQGGYNSVPSPKENFGGYADVQRWTR